MNDIEFLKRVLQRYEYVFHAAIECDYEDLHSIRRILGHCVGGMP